jgi:hypothetical protein
MREMEALDIEQNTRQQLPVGQHRRENEVAVVAWGVRAGVGCSRHSDGGVGRELHHRARHNRGRAVVLIHKRAHSRDTQIRAANHIILRNVHNQKVVHHTAVAQIGVRVPRLHILQSVEGESEGGVEIRGRAVGLEQQTITAARLKDQGSVLTQQSTQRTVGG